jgi:hypothetical protein
MKASDFAKTPGKLEQRETCKALVSKADNRPKPRLRQGIIETASIRFGPKEKVEAYSKDVDSFLKTCPLCRKQGIFAILDNLTRLGANRYP